MFTIFLLFIVISLCGLIYWAHCKHADALNDITTELVKLRRIVAPTKVGSVSPIKPTVPPDAA